MGGRMHACMCVCVCVCACVCVGVWVGGCVGVWVCDDRSQWPSCRVRLHAGAPPGTAGCDSGGRGKWRWGTAAVGGAVVQAGTRGEGDGCLDGQDDAGIPEEEDQREVQRETRRELNALPHTGIQSLDAVRRHVWVLPTRTCTTLACFPRPIFKWHLQGGSPVCYVQSQNSCV